MSLDVEKQVAGRIQNGLSMWMANGGDPTAWLTEQIQLKAVELKVLANCLTRVGQD